MLARSPVGFVGRWWSAFPASAIESKGRDIVLCFSWHQGTQHFGPCSFYQMCSGRFGDFECPGLSAWGKHLRGYGLQFWPSLDSCPLVSWTWNFSNWNMEPVFSAPYSSASALCTDCPEFGKFALGHWAWSWFSGGGQMWSLSNCVSFASLVANWLAQNQWWAWGHARSDESFLSLHFGRWWQVCVSSLVGQRWCQWNCWVKLWWA